MSEQEDRELTQIRHTIAFGMDVKAFMGSPIGRYLTQRANTARESALEALAKVDPYQPLEVQKLQNQIEVAENFLVWMGEAVTDGENAERVFIENEG